ncbi:MAG TPA: hypothetical protein PK208_14095 [Fibrobacteria bacterium]|nr:hypothetical protein [Fibrobacteria bacterium]
MAAQLSATNGDSDRRLWECRWRAQTSLPVPDSPSSSTVESSRATARRLRSRVAKGESGA